MSKAGIEAAIAAAGDQKKLAEALEVSEVFISGAKRKGWLPLKRAQIASDMFGIPLIDLVRDDIAAAMRRQSK